MGRWSQATVESFYSSGFYSVYSGTCCPIETASGCSGFALSFTEKTLICYVNIPWSIKFFFWRKKMHILYSYVLIWMASLSNIFQLFSCFVGQFLCCHFYVTSFIVLKNMNAARSKYSYFHSMCTNRLFSFLPLGSAFTQFFPVLSENWIWSPSLREWTCKIP